MASTLPRKKGDQVTTFASDVDTAENAPEGLHDRKPTAKSETVDSNARTLGGTLADLWARGVAALKETETKPTQFREDARIWQLYLEEAEEKAQDKAEIWKTGLDSLLIYAGLFASVVSSFVIDVRSDLQPDREPRLLSDILDFLRTASTDNAPGIPSSAYRIHGLWIVSLFTTIFSAIMGVLAKAWLAKYTPAKNRGKATDAYRRYKLDRESERWYLKEVLILAPLFVQIASVLFLAGLILQALGDNPSTGQALLGLCIATGLGYFYVTFLPLFIPSSPFNTPLSELLRALYTRKSDGEDRPAFESDIDDGLGEILYHKLVMSGKSLLIDGAVAEVALPGFDPKWTNFLCKNETPHIVLARFEECATSRTISAAQRDEILGNHLLALLSFTELYHANLKMANRDLEANDGELTKATATLDDLGSYRGLDVALQNALEHGRPLHSWNDLPDAVRPLLFALRANVLLTLPKSTSTGYTVSSRQTPSDFNDSELTDRPWEMTFRDTLPGHRIHFTLAACCGLVQGEKNLKQISSFILCLCLAKASFMASETGRTSEWASTLTADKHDGVRTLTLRYLSRLYEATVLGWEDMVADALREISSIETPVGLGDEGGMGELASGVPRLLLLSLSQPNHSMRAHAFKMLTTWICTASSGPSHTPASLKSISTSDLQCIADIAIFDDQAMQDNGLALLVELTRAADEDMVERVKDALVVSIRSGLMKHEDPATQIATMNFIEKLSRTARDRVAVPVIADAILALDNLFRNFPAESVRQATRVLFQGLRLSDHTALTDALKAAILEHLIKIFGAKRGISALNEFLGELVTVIEQDRFETDEGRPPWTYPWNNRLDLIHGLGGMFGSLVEAAIGAYDSIDGDISDSALSALKLLSTRISFKEHMELDVLRWLEPIASPSDSWRARYNAVAVVAIFSKEMDVSPTLLHLLVKTALKDDDSDVRFVSLELASNLFQGNSIATDTADTVKQLIINEFDIEKDSYKRLEPREEEKWLTFIHDISQCAPFPEAIPIIIQTAMNGAAHSDSFDFISQAVAVLISDEFARDSSEFQVLGKCQPPELAAVLPPPEPQSLSQAARWVRLLIGLLARTELRAMVMHVLQGVVTSVRGTAYMHTASEDDAATPASEIANESKQGPTASQARALELLRGCDADERVHWVEIFSMISEISTKDFPDAPDLLIEIILHFDDSEIQSAVLKSLLSLGRQDSTSDGLRNSVLLNVDRMSATYDWEVRAALPRLLTGLGVSTDVKSRLDEKSLTVLKAMALEDGDYDVRSETIVFLSSLSSVNEGEYLFQSDLGTGDRDVKEMALQLFDKGIVDGHHLPRQSWLKFAVSHINEASSSRVTSIFNVAIQDSNSSVRKEASNALYRLLSDTNLRDSFASRLGKDIAIAIKDREHIASAISLLVWLTSTKPKDEVMKDDTHPVQTIDHDYKLYPLDGLDSTLSGGHDAWVRLVMLLGRYDFQGVPILVEAAMKDKAGKTFRDLGAAFGKVKLLDQIQAELPGYLHRALSETKSNTRLEAVNFLASLLCAESGDSLILGDPNDVHPIIMSRLADISVKDDDSRLRNRSLKLLRSLLTADRFRDTIGSCWCKSIEACLSGQETWKYRTNAIRILSELTDTDFVSPALVRVRSIPVTRSGSSEANNGSLSGESSILRGPFSSGALAKAIRSANPREGSEFDKAYKTLNRIILPSIPILLRITLVSDKEPGENLREVAEDILLKKLKVYHGGMRLNEEVLSMIPSMIPTITTDGKRIALRIIETLQVSDDKALSVAHALVPLLRNPSSFSRAIAVELLSGLYRKYRLSKPRMIESSIQEVIALALDEKDNVGEIRRTAVQLLAALSEPLEVTDGPASAKAPVVRPTIQLATQFMVLLQNEDLRPSVVELLSLMATQVAVRSAISVQIMASSFMPDGTLIQGHTELLARLISDGRFADETTDKVMLFLASTMITRPKLARYRFEILTALWCRYATKGIAPYRVKRVTLPFSGQADTAPPRVDFYLKPVDSDKSTQQLVDWFNFAMFGRHASVYEVEKYLTKSALCLPKLTVDSAEVTKCTVKEERISTARTSPLTLTDA